MGGEKRRAEEEEVAFQRLYHKSLACKVFTGGRKWRWLDLKRDRLRCAMEYQAYGTFLLPHILTMITNR